MNRSASNADAVSVRLARGADSTGWSRYLAGSANRTFGHRWEWQEILSNSFGVRPFYFLAERGDSIVGLLPTAFMKSMFFGRFLISLPWLDYGGPVADNDKIAAMLVDSAISTAAEKGCRFLEMRAVRHRLPDLTEKLDKHEFHLDLSGGIDEVWKSFDAKARNQVRKAEKAGLTAEFGQSELLGEFYGIFARNMRDLGTPVWPRRLFGEIFRLFPGDTEICLVRLGQRAIAGGLLIHYEDSSAVPSASAYREHLNLCPNNLMYWEIIKRCIERGSRLFDFGRSSAGAGTFRFKKQWVKSPRVQHWQYKLLTIDSLPELNPSNPKFKTAVAIWRKLPLPIANLLGPRIVTKLP